MGRERVKNVVRLGSRLVGEKQPVFIVAEAGVNHNGSVRLAKKLIDMAKNAGADAVKFQMFSAEKLVTKTAAKAAYQKKVSGKTQYEMLKKLELSKSEFRALKKHADKVGITFLVSPFDEEAVDFLDGLGVPAFKVASGELTNLPFLEYVARKNKPIILSTGMSTLQEIKEAVATIKKTANKKIILLHCVSNYPAKLEDSNLKAIHTMKKSFNLPVGYSDHTIGISASIAAAALGACLIEKHFTLDKNLPGPDHRASAEPDELKELVRRVREVEAVLGSAEKKPAKSEIEIKLIARKSIVAKTNIKKGTIITKAMLTCKRPGDGLAPKFLDKVVGRVAKTDIKKDEKITWKKIR